MKHDSAIGKQIKGYFMHRKSGADAHRFERGMEKDPFLYDAIAGMDDMLTSNLQQAFDELDDALDQTRMPSGKTIKNVAVGAGILFLLVLLYFGFRSVSKDATATSPAPVSPSYAPRQEVPTTADEPAEERPNPDSGAADTPVEPVASKAIVPLATEAAGKPVARAVPLPTKKEKDMVKPRLKEVGTVSGSEPSAEVRGLDPSAEAAQPIGNKEPTESPAGENKPAVSNNKPAPSNGMTSYQGYLRSNIRKTEGMPDGAVLLSFEVDKAGRPRKISVVNSLCTACDAEAIRLIQTGPAWQTSDKKARATVEVPFR